MLVKNYEISFPCPACDSQLTIQTQKAKGPCPKCGQSIEVQLNLTTRERETATLKLAPKSETRRFRPSTGPSHSGPRASHKLSDYAS